MFYKLLINKINLFAGRSLSPLLIINATASRYGGARTILKEVVHEASKYEYCVVVFVNDTLELPQYDNVLYVTQDTSNWLVRLFWDAFFLPIILKNLSFKVFFIISLQNIGVRYQVPQIVYYHQPLPFTNFKLPLSFNSLKLLVYRDFYLFFVKFISLPGTNFVVQSDWLKKSFASRLKIQESLVHVIKPSLPSVARPISDSSISGLFFYPASNVFYKNHYLLFHAFADAKRRFPNLMCSVKLNITLSSSEAPELSSLAHKLQITDIVNFCGYAPSSVVFEYYKSCHCLLFPSYIETFGLPLAEAASIGKEIICSDTEFAHDVLSGYSNVTYLNYNDITLWSDAIISTVKRNYFCIDIPFRYLNSKSLFDVLHKICKSV